MKRELFNKLVAITIDRITTICSESERLQASDDEKAKMAKSDVKYFFDVEESDLTEGELDESDVTPYLQYTQIYLDSMNGV